jgi:hypothetical protein
MSDRSKATNSFRVGNWVRVNDGPRISSLTGRLYRIAELDEQTARLQAWDRFDSCLSNSYTPTTPSDLEKNYTRADPPTPKNGKPRTRNAGPDNPGRPARAERDGGALLAELSEQDGFVRVPVRLTQALGFELAAFLAYLIDHRDYKAKPDNPEGWFYCTEKTVRGVMRSATRKVQDRLFAALRDSGLIETELGENLLATGRIPAGMPPSNAARRYVRVNDEAVRGLVNRCGA